MTNASAALRTNSRSLSAVVDHHRTGSSMMTGQPPPTPPPPPLKARSHGTVHPATRRRAPAVPPTSLPADDDVLDDMLEPDPVLQNERNDVIWQLRVDCAVAAPKTSSGVPELSLGGGRGLPRRCPSPEPLMPWSPRPSRCRQCVGVYASPLDSSLTSDHAQAADFIGLNPLGSRADNDYVGEPSTVPDAATPMRLSDLPSGAPTTRRIETSADWKLASKTSVNSSYSLRAAVSGVTCKQCGGCRCAYCQHTSLPWTCLSLRGNQCRCTGRCTVRTVLGVCIPCFSPCWSRTVSSCRGRCDHRPNVCRCRADSV